MLARQGEDPLTISLPVLDVRIAQFVLSPDSPSVTDSTEVEDIREQVKYLHEASVNL